MQLLNNVWFWPRRPASCSWSHKSCNSETFSVSPASSISTGGTSTCEGTAAACTARDTWPAWPAVRPVVVSTGGFTAVGFLGEASKAMLFFCWEFEMAPKNLKEKSIWFCSLLFCLFSYSTCFSKDQINFKKRNVAHLLKNWHKLISPFHFRGSQGWRGHNAACKLFRGSISGIFLNSWHGAKGKKARNKKCTWY